MTINRTFAAAVALSLTAVLGACGSADSGSSDTTTSNSKAAPAAAKYKAGDEVELATIYKDVAAAMKDKKSYTFKGATGQGDVSGSFRTDGDSPAMKLQSKVQGQDMNILLVDGVMYLEGMPGMEAGKKYLKIDPKGDDPFSKMMGPALSQMTESMDPVSSLQQLDGVKSTVVDSSDKGTTLKTTVSAEQQQEMAKKQLEKMGMGNLPMPTPSTALQPMTITQTIGADNLPTKVEISGGPGAASTMTLTYSGWGEPVDIAAPPASEVGTFDMGQLGQMTG